jgi:hypothetical protein
VYPNFEKLFRDIDPNEAASFFSGFNEHEFSSPFPGLVEFGLCGAKQLFGLMENGCNDQRSATGSWHQDAIGLLHPRLIANSDRPELQNTRSINDMP